MHERHAGRDGGVRLTSNFAPIESVPSEDDVEVAEPPGVARRGSGPASVTTRSAGRDGAEPLGRNGDFRAADVAGVVEQLAGQVRDVGHVGIDEPERADAGPRQRERAGQPSPPTP
jgi:hypothetical protein